MPRSTLLLREPMARRARKARLRHSLFARNGVASDDASEADPSEPNGGEAHHSSPHAGRPTKDSATARIGDAMLKTLPIVAHRSGADALWGRDLTAGIADGAAHRGSSLPDGQS